MTGLNQLLLLPAIQKRPLLFFHFCQAWATTEERLTRDDRLARALAILRKDLDPPDMQAECDAAKLQGGSDGLEEWKPTWEDVSKLKVHLRSVIFAEDITFPPPADRTFLETPPVDVPPPRQCPLASTLPGTHEVTVMSCQIRRRAMPVATPGAPAASLALEAAAQPSAR